MGTAEASDAVYDDMRPERGDFAGAIATAGVGGDGIDSVGADADPRQASLAAALARVLETGGADKVSIFSDHASGAPTALRAPGDLDVALFVDGPELFALGANSSVPLGRLPSRPPSPRCRLRCGIRALERVGDPARTRWPGRVLARPSARDSPGSPALTRPRPSPHP